MIKLKLAKTTVELFESHLQTKLSSFGKRLKLKLPGKENNQFLAGQIETGVKNCKLFEGVSQSSCNLAGINLNPKNAHRANKFYFLRVHQY